MATTHTRMTLATFLARPESDEKRLELIDGVVFDRTYRRWGHSVYGGLIGMRLFKHGFPALGVRAIVPPNHAPIADLAFYRADPPADDAYVTHPPDLVAEVTADFGERKRIARKAEIYRAFGCRSVWIIDFARDEVEVYEEGSARSTARPTPSEPPSCPSWSCPSLSCSRARSGSNRIRLP